MSGIGIVLLCWGIAAVIGYAGGAFIKSRRGAPAKPDDEGPTTEATNDPAEEPHPHWTESLDNTEEANDRDDDWEWEREDDWGDPWDQEDDQ